MSIQSESYNILQNPHYIAAGLHILCAYPVIEEHIPTTFSSAVFIDFGTLLFNFIPLCCSLFAFTIWEQAHKAHRNIFLPCITRSYSRFPFFAIKLKTYVHNLYTPSQWLHIGSYQKFITYSILEWFTTCG